MPQNVFHLIGQIGTCKLNNLFWDFSFKIELQIYFIKLTSIFKTYNPYIYFLNANENECNLLILYKIKKKNHVKVCAHINLID
jgi:hypothetical protein